MRGAAVSARPPFTPHSVDRTVSGKNETAGDTINIVFDPLKNAVKTLRLLGRSTIASGRYVDLEKEQRQKAEKEKARRDSLAAAGVPADSLTKVEGVNDKVVPHRPNLLNVQKKAIKRAKEAQKKKEESP